MATSMTKNGDKWVLTLEEQVKTLATKDKYVDANIEVNVTDAELAGGGAEVVVSTADTTYTQAAATSYPVVIRAEVGDADVTVSKAGWVSTDDKATIAGDDDEKTLYIKEGALKGANGGAVTATAALPDTTYLTDTNTGYKITATADASAADSTTGVATAGWVPTTATATVVGQTATQAKAEKYIKAGQIEASDATATATGSGVTLGTAQTTAPASGKYIKVDGSATASVKTAGWVNADNNPAVTDSATTYYPINGAGYDNKPAAGKTAGDYATVEGPVLVEGGYLYITGGFADDVKMSLADLVPDGSTVGAATTSDLLYKTEKMYNDDGKTVAGTMGDAVIGAVKDTDGKVTPVIADAAVSGTNVAKHGTLAAAAPTDGSYYVAVNTAAIDGVTAVTPKVTTTGYAVKDAVGADVEVVRGANAAATKYIPITAGAIDTTAETITATAVVADGADGQVTPVIKSVTGGNVTPGTLTTTKPSSGNYIAVATSAIEKTVDVTVSTAGAGDITVTEGYIPGQTISIGATGTGTTVTAGAAAAATTYIPLAAGEIGATATKGTDGAVKPVIATQTVADANAVVINTASTTAPASGRYIAVKTAEITASTDVTPSAEGVTAGYITTSTTGTGDAVTVTRGASASDTLYISLNVYNGELL